MLDRIKTINFTTDDTAHTGWPYMAKVTDVYTTQDLSSIDMSEWLMAEINSWILAHILLVAVLNDRFGREEEERWFIESSYCDNIKIYFANADDFMIFKLMFA